MSEARDIELGPIQDRVGYLDLVVVSPNDPEAMLRHTAECRERSIPFAADPSQQLSFMGGEDIRQLVDGAAYLFTNEYEAALTEQKTGWSAEEILDRVGTRVTTRGAKGAIIESKGAEPIEVPVVAIGEVVDPTGVGDAFRAGYLAGLAWVCLRSAVRRSGPCWPHWSLRQPELRSTHSSVVLSSVGSRLPTEARRRRKSAATSHPRSSNQREIDGTGGAVMTSYPIEPPLCRWELPDLSRAGDDQELVGIGADLAPGTMLAGYRSGLFPMGCGCLTAKRPWGGGRRTHEEFCDPRRFTSVVHCVGRCCGLNSAWMLRSMRLWLPVPTRLAHTAGSTAAFRMLIERCTTSDGRIRSRSGGLKGLGPGNWSAASLEFRSGTVCCRIQVPS